MAWDKRWLFCSCFGRVLGFISCAEFLLFLSEFFREINKFALITEFIVLSAIFVWNYSPFSCFTRFLDVGLFAKAINDLVELCFRFVFYLNWSNFMLFIYLSHNMNSITYLSFFQKNITFSCF